MLLILVFLANVVLFISHKISYLQHKQIKIKIRREQRFFSQSLILIYFYFVFLFTDLMIGHTILSCGKIN